MLFSKKLVNIDDIKLKIGQYDLTITASYNLFGINFYNILKFNSHIKSFVCIVAKSNRILYRIRKFLIMEARFNFFMHLCTITFHTILHYGETLTKILQDLSSLL